MTDDAAIEHHSTHRLAEKRFVVDTMLGKLAKWLRVLGFDTRYEALNSPWQLDEYAHRGYRILTRNGRWAGHPATLWVTGDHVADQLRAVVTTLTITPEEVHLKRRCLRCNICLEQVPRAEVEGRVPDYVFENCSNFYHCPECRRFYWVGTHPSRMDQWLRTTLGWTLTSEPQGDAP
jgi:uncharacterized protein with PIN domain